MRSPLDVARAAVEAIEAAGYVAAIGGALALGVWSQPRATLDADINVFVSAPDWSRVLDILVAEGFELDRAVALRRWENGEVAPARLDGIHVDLFAPSIPFYAEAQQRIRRISFGSYELPFLSAEVLAVFKLLFFRLKDRADLDVLVRDVGPDLDRKWIREQLVGMMGKSDERVVFFDQLCAAASPA